MSLSFVRSQPLWLRIAIPAAVLIAAIFYISSSVEFGDKWLYWLQVFTSNWSPDKKPAVGNFWFNVGIFVALVINYAPFVGIFAALWNLTTNERRTVMKLSHAFALRDAVVQDYLYSKMTLEQAKNLKPLIDAAFKEGSEIWRKNDLVKVFGSDDAARMLKIVDEADANKLQLG